MKIQIPELYAPDPVLLQTALRFTFSNVSWKKGNKQGCLNQRGFSAVMSAPQRGSSRDIEASKPWPTVRLWGTCPPTDLTNDLFVKVHFTAGRSLTATLCGCLSKHLLSVLNLFRVILYATHNFHAVLFICFKTFSRFIKLFALGF